ncbi:hypothetical protein V8C42DRAFT_133890 [Trichoderma barbatum]
MVSQSESLIEYYLTIPSPRSLERVFYPFHVLSRPQAQANHSDWNKVTAFSLFQVRNHKKYYNRYAEAAGHGEAELNGTTMTYWMAC